MNKALATALALSCAFGGAAHAAQKVVQAPPPIISVRADDPEMNAAKARAIAELPAFFRSLAAPGADEADFMLKFDIDPSEEAEFVWAGDLDRSGGALTGVLANQPRNTAHKVGERVAIPERDIIDWSYRRAGIMQGSHTDRVLIERLPEAQARAIRADFGW